MDQIHSKYSKYRQSPRLKMSNELICNANKIDEIEEVNGDDVFPNPHG